MNFSFKWTCWSCEYTTISIEDVQKHYLSQHKPKKSVSVQIPLLPRVDRIKSSPTTVNVSNTLNKIVFYSNSRNANNSKINIYESSSIPKNYFNNSYEYAMHINELNKKGIWSNFYRNATDHKENSIGKHEVKAIRLETINNEH